MRPWPAAVASRELRLRNGTIRRSEDDVFTIFTAARFCWCARYWLQWLIIISNPSRLAYATERVA